MDVYRVTAPYVTVKVETPLGVQVHARQEGALLPAGVLPESIAHHLRKRMIERVEVPADEPEQEGEPPFNQGGVLVPGGGDQPPGGAPDVPPAPPWPATIPDPPEPSAPPESGPGSGKAAWVDYAVQRGLDRGEADAMSRDDLIKALKAE